MTEEIIINGINVTGCEFCKPNPLYKTEYSCHCRGYIQDDCLHVHLSCEHNPNCYYKQLKRLEFELKVTKADYEASEQENKELKDNLKSQQMINLKQQEIALDYWNALEEIKKIVDCANCEYESNDNCNPQQCSKIENKINEVLK